MIDQSDNIKKVLFRRDFNRSQNNKNIFRYELNIDRMNSSTNLAFLTTAEIWVP